MSAIVDEYMLFAFPKPRQEDQRFIEAFSCEDYYDSFESAEKDQEEDLENNTSVRQIV